MSVNAPHPARWNISKAWQCGPRAVRQALDGGVVTTVAFPHAHMAYGTIEGADGWTTHLNPGMVNAPFVVNTAALTDGAREALLAADSAFDMSGTAVGIWFGIILVKMAELCLITPPIGLNCFVVAGVHAEISVQHVFLSASPFFIADALTIVGLIAFPSIVLYLPNLLL